ncbi:MAG TPA: SagB family peptide dehydrogenase [Herpetosiphonaceae bacterium]
MSDMLDVYFAPHTLRIHCRDASQLQPREQRAATWQRRLRDALHRSTSEAELVHMFDRLELERLVLPYYRRLIEQNLLFFTWQPGDRALLTIHPLTPDFTWQNPALACANTLSRFAYVRRDGDRFCLESPEAACIICDLAPELGAWLLTLPEPEPADDRYRQLFDLLALTGFLEPRHEPPTRRYWEFHDRLFHTQSTIHRLNQPFGATYRFAGDHAYPAASQPPHTAQECPLPAPDAELLDTDMLRSLRARRSIRQHGARGMSLAALSTLLFFALNASEARSGGPDLEQAAATPALPTYTKAYPSAGGIHELEFYLIVRLCDGLPAGIYAYDDKQHTLRHLPKVSPYGAHLISNAAHQWGSPNRLPQMVMLITSRLEQLAWKYETIAYRLTLLNAGCAVQTLYLVSASLGTACCALGGINSLLMRFLDQFGEIRGVPLAQIAIGEAGTPAVDQVP